MMRQFYIERTEPPLRTDIQHLLRQVLRIGDRHIGDGSVGSGRRRGFGWTNPLYDSSST
jgi:hypothetical protein